MLIAALVLAVGFVAFTNGANANFKGVASLYGSGTTTREQATLLGTATTFLGSIVSFWLAETMLKSFSGRGLVPDEVAQSPLFVSSVAMGTAITSFLATRLGFPVSTTHALIGSLAGSGWMSVGSELHLQSLVRLFIYPLLFSPFVAFALGSGLYALLVLLRCEGFHRSRFLDSIHVCSAGVASFARGLNDTPKMVALLTCIPNQSLALLFFFVATLIALGGLLDSKKVAETLGRKVTDMNPVQALAGNIITSILVSTASLHSFPVSTTHVSVGALAGIGASTRQAKWPKILEIAVAWVSTVPCGACFAAIVHLLLSRTLAY